MFSNFENLQKPFIIKSLLVVEIAFSTEITSYYCFKCFNLKLKLTYKRFLNGIRNILETGIRNTRGWNPEYLRFKSGILEWSGLPYWGELVGWFVRSFNQSISHSFIHSFICSFVRSFVCSFNQSIIHLSHVLSFIHLPVGPAGRSRGLTHLAASFQRPPVMPNVLPQLNPSHPHHNTNIPNMAVTGDPIDKGLWQWKRPMRGFSITVATNPVTPPTSKQLKVEVRIVPWP